MNTREALLECLPALAYDRAAPRVMAEAASAATALDGAITLADVLALEQQPDTASLAFGDWERNYGLPDDCIRTLVDPTALATGTYANTLADIASFSRASIARYTDAAGLLSTALANNPRFDYDPVTLALRGLLIEAAATNQLSWSNGFHSNVWATSLSVQTVAPSAPHSMEVEYKANELAAVDTFGLSQFVNTVAGNKYTFSIFVKAAERNIVIVQLCAAGLSDGGLAYFDLAVGTVLAVTNLGLNVGATAAIEPAGSGWYRCSVTITAATTDIRYAGFFLGVAQNTTPYLGTAGNGLYVFGAQLEDGPAASSYILTIGGPVTRAADVCSVFIYPSEAQRRVNLLGRLQHLGNLSRQFMIDQAADLGYPLCTITEYGPITCESTCDSPCNGVDFIGVWALNVPTSTAIVYASCESPCNTPLAKWGNTQLECIVNRRKPAHTVAVFTYAP